MGLFDIFKKKNCDICGGEIGLLGNRKLEDGNCCKQCAGKLSPWFEDRKQSTIAQIKEQLAYREENAAQLPAFRATKVIGENKLVYIDERTRRFFVASGDDFLSENPDILSFDQVVSCRLDIDDSCEEIKREETDKDGNTVEVSYTPKRYLNQYDFEMIIQVQHPYFDDMRFRLNDSTLEIETVGTRREGLVSFNSSRMDPTQDAQYRSYVAMGEELTQLLTGTPEAEPQAPEAPAPRICPYCDMPAGEGNFCESCGGKLD